METDNFEVPNLSDCVWTTIGKNKHLIKDNKVYAVISYENDILVTCFDYSESRFSYLNFPCYTRQQAMEWLKRQVGYENIPEPPFFCVI